MTTSRVYPSLERKPGGPDNWVERTGGLPSYIERIAKHLHYEKGYTISHAIATAVNVVKRWAVGGTVTRAGNTQHVSPATAAKAAKAVAEWEAKKRASHATPRHAKISLSLIYAGSPVDLAGLIKRADAVVDPAMRKEAVEKVWDLAIPAFARAAAEAKGQTMPGGAFPITDEVSLKNAIAACNRAKDPAAAKKHIIEQARKLGLMDMLPDTWKVNLSNAYETFIDLAKTKDGRKSFKNQGKWGHGFVPLDGAAKTSKAKGSPIAMQRISRLFGGAKGKQKVKAPKSSQVIEIKAKLGTGSVRAQTAGQALRAQVKPPLPPPATTHAPTPARKIRQGPVKVTRAWADIPDTEKTIRNGVRYVVSTFGGRSSLKAWVEPGGVDVAAPDARNKVMTSILQSDLTKLTTATIRHMLAQPGLSDEMRKKLNAELTRKEKLGLVGGKTR